MGTYPYPKTRSFFSIFFACFVLILAVSANGKNGRYVCSRANAYKQSPAAFPELPLRPYNVISYDVKLDFRPAFKDKLPHLDGQETIDIILTDNTTSIEFDAGGLHISDVTVNGEILASIPQPTADERLIIPLKTKFQEANTDLKINISWQKTTDDNHGFYFYPKGFFVGLGPKPAEDSVFVEEDLAYTMSEPRDAHYWLPCKDDPSDKADCSIRIWVPQGGILATSNGILSDTSSVGGYKIFSYLSDRPIATYLMCASASKFVTWDEKTPRLSNPLDSIRLHYYAWQSDYDQDSITDGSKYNARNAFKNTKNMVRTFEERFGPYPFVQYGQVPVQPFSYGGMEHQTITTINRSWFRGWTEGGIAHELSHQWFGDHVTCETFKDIWLNEGFASYCEAIYNEGWGGNEWYMNTIRGKANGYFTGDNNTIPIYDPPEEILFNGATTYDKAACVIHMLRRMVHNDTAFFSALRGYQDHFSYSNCNTADFRDFMSAWLSLDLSDFFNEWIYGQMHPVYDIYWAQSAGNEIFLRVNQTQDARDHFIMPINFFAWHGGNVDTLRFQNDERSQRFRTVLGYKIDSLTFDDDALVLSQHTMTYDATLSARENASAAQFDVRLDGSRIVARSSESGTMAIYDVVGKEVGTLSLQAGVNSWFDATKLATGTYIVRLFGAGKEMVKVIQIVR